MFHTEKCGDFHIQPDTCMFRDISIVSIVCKFYSQRKPLWQDFISDACSEEHREMKTDKLWRFSSLVFICWYSGFFWVFFKCHWGVILSVMP